jgi:hypothetical protein
MKTKLTLFYFFFQFTILSQEELNELKNQYLNCRTINDQECAFKTAQSMLKISESFGDSSTWYNLSKRYTANSLVSLNKKDEALKIYLEILPFYSKRKNDDYAILMNNIGSIYLESGLLKQAKDYLKNAISIFKEISFPDQKLINYLYNLRQVYIILEEQEDCISIQNDIISCAKKIDYEKYVDEKLGLLWFYIKYEKFDDFQRIYDELKPSIEKDSNPNRIFKLKMYNVLSMVGTSNFNELNNSFSEVIEFVENNIQLRNTGEYLFFATSYSTYLSQNGFYEKAIKINNNSIKIIEAGPEYFENPDYETSIIHNELSNIYAEINDFNSAVYHTNQALTLNKKYLNENHYDILINELNLIGLKYHQGDYKNIESELINLEKKFKESGIPDHFYVNLYLYLMRLNDLSQNKKKEYEYLIKYESIINENKNKISRNEVYNAKIEKINFYLRCDSINNAISIIQGIDNLNEFTDVTKSLLFFSFAQAYKSSNSEKSIDYLNKSLQLKEMIYGINHPYYLNTLEALANFEIENGNYQKAMFKLLSIDSVKTNLAYFPSKLEDLNYLILLIVCEIQTNSNSFLERDIVKMNFNIKKLIKNNFLYLTNSEKMKFINSMRYYSQVLSMPRYTSNNNNLIKEMYNFNLINKGLVQLSSTEIENEIKKNPELLNIYKELKLKKTILVEMEVKNIPIDDRNTLSQEIEFIEKKIINSLNVYGELFEKFEITWKDIQKNLSSKEAAIEFARYYDDMDSSYKYMALVVRPDYEYPKLVTLGDEEAIRTATQFKDFSSLYNLVWKDLDTLLTSVQTVHYSPAGELNNVSFSAMCFEAGDSVLASFELNRGVIISKNNKKKQSCNAVLMDKYELHQLTTTRYLADGTLKKEKPMQPSLTLVGGISFDDIPDKTNEADKEQSNEDFAFHANLNKQSASSNGKKRGKRSSSNYGKRMEPLPGTKEEIVNISGLLNTSNWKVQTKSDKKAGEYEFKKELETKAPGVLHIATHGFAFPDEAKKESKLLDMNQTSTYKVSEDPMVRCGLMLGGSNISWTGNPQKMIEQTGDDGILTAAEVANLDLSNTKLVVLSACETGLGKIEGSEGTFGLKRGFKLAGVEQMIVSLWSVPDKETMELMTLFYSDLTKSLNPVTSFSKAQKEMRNLYPTDPEKWAGFVLVR